MPIKFFTLAVFIAILASLFSGMFFMLRDKGQTTRTAKALTVRIALSVSLFGLLMLAVATGHLKPHGIYPPGHPAYKNAPAP